MKKQALLEHSVTFSNSKHYKTAKALSGITPAEAVSSVSDLYAGRTSDKQATNDCGILGLMEDGDSIMADKGFDIDKSNNALFKKAKIKTKLIVTKISRTEMKIN